MSREQELKSLLEAYIERCRRSSKLEDELKRNTEELHLKEKEIYYLRSQLTEEIYQKEEQIKYGKVEQESLRNKLMSCTAELHQREQEIESLRSNTEFCQKEEEIETLRTQLKKYTAQLHQKEEEIESLINEKEETESFRIQLFLADTPHTEDKTEQRQVSAFIGTFGAKWARAII